MASSNNSGAKRSSAVDDVISISSDDEDLGAHAAAEVSASHRRRHSEERKTSTRPANTRNLSPERPQNRTSKRPRANAPPEKARWDPSTAKNPRQDLEVSADRNEALQEALVAVSAARATLQHELDAAYEASDELLQQLASMTQERDSLQLIVQEGHEHRVKTQGLTDALQSDTTCTVCTSRMWLPYVLPCGHSACQACLREWFSEALMQHLGRNPHLELPNLQPYHEALRNAELTRADRERVKAELIDLLKAYPTPHYTCPICRQSIKTKPIEDIALRSIVCAVANALGEENPTTHGGVEGVRSIWDGFFLPTVDDLELE
ncbi:uncharacterized protein B0H18DRAFT_1120425 [Fomitopsis serialis]|uniref:uncharacterized protein n=1 Tax=Fomitopsis serialis TaxID=139415 RepID=UPI002007BD73|nr:uncharacterized protein B0H18DRAFT_1120425 [Neoantrodia serialis]KAH9923320.1 hypothetical protein B0H18DRAFT_1120425 [Neoantrodia serialis]